jgi:hypothetical protein
MLDLQQWKKCLNMLFSWKPLGSLKYSWITGKNLQEAVVTDGKTVGPNYDPYYTVAKTLESSTNFGTDFWKNKYLQLKQTFGLSRNTQIKHFLSRNKCFTSEILARVNMPFQSKGKQKYYHKEIVKCMKWL